MTEQTRAFAQLILRVHRKHGRDEECRLIDWALAEQDNFETVDAFREAMVARKDWHTGLSVPTLVDCHQIYADEDERERVQIVYAKAIFKDDPKFARGLVEQAIRDHGDKIEDGAMKVLIDWLKEHHPNPKMFVAQHCHHLPENLLLTNLPCPDFPDFEKEHLRGARMAKSKRKAERLKAARAERPA